MPKLLKKISYIIVCLGCLLLSGCSLFHMYRPDIQQGNVITDDMVTQLKPGMTEEQVRYIMGTPVLQNTFDPNQWDYVYTFRHDSQPRKQQHVTLHFNNAGLLQSIQSTPLVIVIEK
jgi:outer membrane protein assembly factor BamE